MSNTSYSLINNRNTQARDATTGRRSSRTALALLCAALAAIGSAACADPDELAPEDAGDDEELTPRALCSGSGCNGDDPHDSGCDLDAVTLATRSFSNGKLELRYSNTCKTKWAKVTRNDGKKYSTAWIEKTDGGLRNETWDGVNWNYMWSWQWYTPGVSVRACSQITSCSGPCGSYAEYCTIFNSK